MHQSYSIALQKKKKKKKKKNQFREPHPTTIQLPFVPMAEAWRLMKGLDPRKNLTKLCFLAARDMRLNCRVRHLSLVNDRKSLLLS